MIVILKDLEKIEDMELFHYLEENKALGFIIKDIKEINPDSCGIVNIVTEEHLFIIPFECIVAFHDDDTYEIMADMEKYLEEYAEKHLKD